MDDLISKLQYIIPDIKFSKGASFCWSPANRTISYGPAGSHAPQDMWSLLHEAGHASLGHTDYGSDVQLVMLEAAAWEKAKIIGLAVGVNIDEDHIQDCIDTYRDWLHQRSTCPRCGVVCLQSSPTTYDCHNCSCHWQVSSARFCRPYRLTSYNTKRPQAESTTQTATFS